ncbi:ABC transporter ATP-binding protein [Rugamonas sp.]|uniref:ABC transporter ATP-binding protein n=1 Tax=Rugamonas sp. TaxID=1926287 RepID=UPI0025D4E22C|nr:ABC transporter ATP-binding protein [Rugamonas sp.]
MSHPSHPGHTPLVELRGVSKQYRLGGTAIRALAGIDLRIDAGEFVAVWGPSGSGKSTLCNLIGLLDAPSAGTVNFRGGDVARLSDDQRSEVRNCGIGFVFQGFNLVPVLSALENVMLPLQIGGASASVARARARRRLEEVGLGAQLAQRPAKLSGGQQQRVAIARALVTEPVLVVADEPTANLDTANAVIIIELMRQISRREGTTFVFSTHDDRLLARVDRQLMLRDGMAVDDVLRRADHAERVPA